VKAGEFHSGVVAWGGRAGANPPNVREADGRANLPAPCVRYEFPSGDWMSHRQPEPNAPFVDDGIGSGLIPGERYRDQYERRVEFVGELPRPF